MFLQLKKFNLQDHKDGFKNRFLKYIKEIKNK